VRKVAVRRECVEVRQVAATVGGIRLHAAALRQRPLSRTRKSAYMHVYRQGARRLFSTRARSLPAENA